jgi:CHAT domain-containing protein
MGHRQLSSFLAIIVIAGLLHAGPTHPTTAAYAAPLGQEAQPATDQAREHEADRLYDEAETLYRKGDRQGALDRLDQALGLYRRVGDHAGEGRSLQAIGVIYSKLGPYPQALDYSERALAIWRELGDRAGEAGTLADIGLAHERRGEPQQALVYYRHSIEVSESIRASATLEEFKTSLAGRYAHAYERAVLLLMRLGHVQEAFDVSERARARTFLDQMGNAHLDVLRRGDPRLLEQEQALRLELATLGRRLRQAGGSRGQPRDDAIRALVAEQATKQSEYEHLLTRLKLSNPEYASLVSVDPLTLAAVQERLDRDTTLLSYFVTRDETLAFAVTRESFAAVQIPVGEQDLQDAINQFRDSHPSDPMPSSLPQLHAWLVAPVRAHLLTPAVGIVPHGVLHYLPFAALTDGRRYFGDDHVLFSLPSASTLDFVQQKRKGDMGSLLAVAQGQAEGLPPLRHAEQEARTIAALYGTRALVGGEATESAFSAGARGAGILHLAAHGQLNTASPLFSRIVLAPDGVSDGSLEVHEVYGLDLASADLVVLSACQTQLGAQSRGDDVVGLNRAFIYAGAPTVIASLWSVDDQATREFMTSFYAHLRQGMGKAAALQAAQAALRVQERYRHPYFWAAFVLTGDPGAGPAQARSPAT